MAVSLIATARPDAEIPTLPATVSFQILPSGELETKPAAPQRVLATAPLRPGDAHARARFSIRNQTAKELSVGFSADSPETNLDGLLRVRLRSGGETLANTTLQGLRKQSGSYLPLRSGAGAEVSLEAWLPRSVESGYESARARITLVPTLEGGER